MIPGGSLCAACRAELPTDARFCSQCGASVSVAALLAEYKQVTVLFADVVHSMALASRLGPERLREVMTDVFHRCVDVVRRFGGTVDKFTGDGLMAIFGAPIALEDHAFRACLASLKIQDRMTDLDLELRIGLNSGLVIAGDIDSGMGGYTAVGEQVGMAQRMEAAAPPGAVMLSESTARLVENVATLGETELVRIKDTDTAVPARRLLAIGDAETTCRTESTLVGRNWELAAISAILDDIRPGTGCVVNIVGPPGIGKSRLIRETIALAGRRGIPVAATHCDSHTSDVPFHAAAKFLRAAARIDVVAQEEARAHLHARFSDADPDDLRLLADLLGVSDESLPRPDIAPDARRRRMLSLVTSAAIARDETVVYVVEDIHWIDEASESLAAEFLEMMSQAPAMVLFTHRPEYRGGLARLAGAQTIALRPLNEADATMLIAELLGTDPSVDALKAQVAAQAAGNPFFVEEMVRDLVERGVLEGARGAYRLRDATARVDVPASLQAAIAARIDRLGAGAKTTLNAAAVIGSRFDPSGLAVLAERVDIAPLIEADLVEQVRSTPHPVYAFRHPLIRTVAYESQLRSNRATLHRRLADAISSNGSPDENAALIAEHLEAGEDLRSAFTWHMRAGSWLTNRDIAAAQSSWRRALQVADRLPVDDPDRLAMRIGPRTLLAGSAWRVSGSGAETGFEELRELCEAAGDRRSLAIGMAGHLIVQNMRARGREASAIAEQLVELLESIGDPLLELGLLPLAVIGQVDTVNLSRALRFAERVVELAEGDPLKGSLIVGSPLASGFAMRGVARSCLGLPGWRDDFRTAVDMTRQREPFMVAGNLWYACAIPISYGMVLPDAGTLSDTAAVLERAERSGDNLALDLIWAARGVALIHSGRADQELGYELLTKVREAALNDHFSLTNLPLANSQLARRQARLGNLDEAVELARSAIGDLSVQGTGIWYPLATTALVEALLARSGSGDLVEARSTVDRLAAVPTDPGFVLNEITVLRLRTLLAQALGDERSYRVNRDSYRRRAAELGFEGHIAMAGALP